MIERNEFFFKGRGCRMNFLKKNILFFILCIYFKVSI